MQSSLTDEPVLLGYIAAAYGIKGWVKVVSNTEPKEALLEYSPWLIRHKGSSWKQITLVSGKVHGKGLVVQLSGCNDRLAAEQYRGTEIAIKSEQLPELAEDEFYWRDLEGLNVVVAGVEPILLGKVAYMLATGANDVLVIKGCDGSIDNKERLVPYLWGQVIQSVNLDVGEIQVNWDPEF